MRRSVLVVDDDLHIQELLKLMLEQAGFEYHKCKDGYTALEELGSKPYDLVILDIHMPHLNGMKVLEKMRSDDELKNIPVLMLTTDADKAQVIKATQYEVTDYVLKPPKRDDLLSRVERVLGGRPQFQQIEIDPEDPRGHGNFETKSRVHSMSRRGFVLHCENKFEEGTYMSNLTLPLFLEIGIDRDSFIISKVEKAPEGGYFHYFSFAQLSDAEREKLSEWVMEESFKNKVA